MGEHIEPHHDHEWTPATSQPGEIFTPEGEIAAWGAFARGLHQHDERHRRYRRQMAAPGWWILGLGLGVVALIVLFSAMF